MTAAGRQRIGMIGPRIDQEGTRPASGAGER